MLQKVLVFGVSYIDLCSFWLFWGTTHGYLRMLTEPGFCTPMSDLTHFDSSGKSRMVDVGEKSVTRRMARASALVTMKAETLDLIKSGEIGKGDVLGVSRVAGIMATKRTSDLIPLCHPIPIDGVTVEFEFLDKHRIQVTATVYTSGKTGVEMESLTCVGVVGLTIYDMCKSVDREMVVTDVRLEEKSGGKSGHFQRASQPDS